MPKDFTITKSGNIINSTLNIPSYDGLSIQTTEKKSHLNLTERSMSSYFGLRLQECAGSKA